jgi:hypothetical protein
MALGAKIIDFVRLDVLQDTRQVRTVGQIPVVQLKPRVIDMGIGVDMVDALRVEQRRAPLDTMNLIPFREQKFSKVGAILSRDTSDKSNFFFPQNLTTYTFLHLFLLPLIS